GRSRRSSCRTRGRSSPAPISRPTTGTAARASSRSSDGWMRRGARSARTSRAAPPRSPARWSRGPASPPAAPRSLSRPGASASSAPPFRASSTPITAASAVRRRSRRISRLPGFSSRQRQAGPRPPPRRGGIRAHLGGGFHRYSTDAEWFLPHFEKMLTDNAQLLGVYARAYALTGNDLYRRVARETGEYLLREMAGPEGGFYASTDADSEGEEGKYFVWDPSEIRELLGEDEGRDFCEWYGVQEGGNFFDEASGHRTGANILHLSKKIPPESEERLAPLRAALLAARSR